MTNIDKYLHAGKVKYKLYHGYNFNKLLDLFSLYDYKLSSFYQANGVFKIWFVNIQNPIKRIILSEYSKSSSLGLYGFTTRTEEIPTYCQFSTINKNFIIDPYFTKVNGLYYMDMEKIESVINEIESFFKENA